MNSFRFLTAPVFALFDLKLYREASQSSAGKAVLYCAYLALIFCFAASVVMSAFIPKADDFVRWLKKEWPPVTLTASGLKLDATPGQKTLVHPNYGPIVAFDDTKTTISEEEMGNFYFYLTSTMLYTRSQNNFQARALPGLQGSIEKRKVEQIRLEGDKIEQAYFKFKPLVVALFVGIVFVFGFISRLIASLLLSILGYLIQIFIPRKLSFEKMFTVAAFSLSVGLLFSVLQMVPAISRFFPGFLGIIISVIYFSIAIAVQDKPEVA